MRPSTCGDHRSRCNEGANLKAPACFFWRPSGSEAAQAHAFRPESISDGVPTASKCVNCLCVYQRILI